MTPVPATPAAESIEQRVVRLLGRWREETAYLSSSTRLTGHPAYQELIALGPAALPFLFRDLEQTGDGHLSKALAAITGAPPGPRGRLRPGAQGRGSLAALGQGERPPMVERAAVMNRLTEGEAGRTNNPARSSGAVSCRECHHRPAGSKPTVKREVNRNARERQNGWADFFSLDAVVRCPRIGKPAPY